VQRKPGFTFTIAAAAGLRYAERFGDVCPDGVQLGPRNSSDRLTVQTLLRGSRDHVCRSERHTSPFSRVGTITTASCEIIVEAFVVKGTTMTFGCSAAKRSVSSTITHGRVLFASLGSPSPRQSNTHISPAADLAICVSGNAIPEVVKLLCLRVVAVVLCRASRLCVNIGLSNQLRAVGREIAKARCKTDAVLLGLSLERCANFIVEPDGNGSSHNQI
jgi:hypothetical protein